MPVEFAINAFNWKAIVFFVLVVVLPLFVTGIIVCFMLYKAQQIMLAKVIFCAIIILVGALCSVGFWQLSSVKIRLDAQTLVVGGGLYQVSLPMEQIDRSAVRQWTTEEDDGYAPGLRTNGIGMPGVALGWFISKRSKIFAAITQQDNVVIIPTTAGYTILASPDHPHEFVKKIHAL